MRTLTAGFLIATLLGWTAMSVSEVYGEGEGGYPVPWPARPAAESDALEAKFLAANGEAWFGQAARHTATIAAVQQVELLEKGEEGLVTRADAAAVEQVLAFVAKNAEALGFGTDQVEAGPVWVPGWGAAVGLVFKPGTGARFSLGRFLALDAVARVAGDPPRVASLAVFSFPLPDAAKIPVARIDVAAAKAALVGQKASVARPKAAGPETVVVAAENLGESRERIQAAPLGPERFGLRRVLEIDFHSGPAASSPLIGHWFVDAVTGEVHGQDMVPPPLGN